MSKAALLSGFLGVSLLGMPVLAQDSPYPRIDSCEYQVSISDNTLDNTIRIQVAEGNTCPISDKVFLFIQDNRPQPLRLPGVRENFFSSTWVVRPGDARPGQYRVMGFDPMPSGIGDNSPISAGDLGIDQVITIGGTQGQGQSAPALPQVVLPPAPQPQVTTLDSESKQLLRNFDQWMRWFQVNIWPQLQTLLRAIEGIKNS
jgi:hypothetical protein